MRYDSCRTPSLKNLTWKNVINQNLQCLDEASGLPAVEINLDWDKRSDLVYALELRKMPRVLDEHELAEAEVELTHPKAPEWLKRHKTSTMTEQTSTTVYERTGKTDPKDPRRYKQLTSTKEKLTPHTLQLNKGACREGNKNAGDTEKTKAATKCASMVEEDLRRKKRRVLESSDDETDEEDEIERANERDKGDTTAEASESDKQAGVTKEPSEPD